MSHPGLPWTAAGVPKRRRGVSWGGGRERLGGYVTIGVMKPAATKMTYAGYRFFPDDGKRYELVDGELLMTPAPSTRHQRILRRLGFQLSAYVEANGLGEIFISPIDVVFEEHLVLQPDILLVRRERQAIVGADQYLPRFPVSGVF